MEVNYRITNRIKIIYLTQPTNMKALMTKTDINDTCLPFGILEAMPQRAEYIGTTDDLWSPYTQYVTHSKYHHKHNYRLDSVEVGQFTLGESIMNNNNIRINNNFEGYLDADE